MNRELSGPPALAVGRLSSLVREDGNQSRDGQPQKALDQKENKSPKAQSLDPGLKAHLILASLRDDDQPSE